MSDMEREDLPELPEARGMCDECLRNARVEKWDDERVIVAYCEHNSTGGFTWLSHPAFWIMAGPLTSDMFEAALNVAGIRAIAAHTKRGLLDSSN